jgi:FkbM family methyltransferase
VTGDICSLYWEVNNEILTDCAKFLEDNRSEFLNFYNKLGDEKSKQHMTAFFNQKVSGKMEYLSELWEENEYYDKKIVNFSKIHTFIDCGAYDGDSYKSFLENYKSNLDKEYEGNALLLEPDEKNYEKLLANFPCTEKINCFKIGAWHEKDLLAFKGELEVSSAISENGDRVIEVDTIDNLVGDKGTEFIKMDIEGAELNALQGAENTIKKFKPTLAICVYHKKDDLLTIPQYLHSVCPEYKFYLRAHGKYCHNLILYAV